METGIHEKLEWNYESLAFLKPELILTSGILCLLILGLATKNKYHTLYFTLSVTVVAASLLISFIDVSLYDNQPVKLFLGMIRLDDFSSAFKVLIDAGSLLFLILALQQKSKRSSEFFSLSLGIVLGSHLLVMSMNLIMVFLSVELISICSYALTFFSFSKKSAEGALKYFLFGSIASAVMVYGFSWLFGISQTLNFTSQLFVNKLSMQPGFVFLVVGSLSLCGYLYKIAAAPMHPWAPDVYESAPTSVVAFLSGVPKVAGMAALTKFFLALYLYGQSRVDWQQVIAMVAMLTILIGNLAALWQSNFKRLMAYSSIAQSGFLLLGLVAFSMQGIHMLIFYAVAYLLANYLVFFVIQQFETAGVHSVDQLAGSGKKNALLNIFILIGLISLTGLPPTAGFTAKLFVFTGVWQAYISREKVIFLSLFLVGLLNTAIALFYYLRAPYYAFLKSGDAARIIVTNVFLKNLFGLLLVLGLLTLFFRPDLLMGWINRINFVL